MLLGPAEECYWGLQTLFSAPWRLFPSSRFHWPLTGSGSVVGSIRSASQVCKWKSEEHGSRKVHSQSYRPAHMRTLALPQAGIPSSSSFEVLLCCCRSFVGVVLDINKSPIVSFCRVNYKICREVDCTLIKFWFDHFSASGFAIKCTDFFVFLLWSCLRILANITY